MFMGTDIRCSLKSSIKSFVVRTELNKVVGVERNPYYIF